MFSESEFMVTQSITSPVTSISQSGQHMMEGQHNHIPPPNCVLMPHMIPQMEGQQQPQTPAEKKKKVCIHTESRLLINVHDIFI
jgi:hypothetical protein